MEWDQLHEGSVAHSVLRSDTDCSEAHLRVSGDTGWSSVEVLIAFDHVRADIAKALAQEIVVEAEKIIARGKGYQ